ncbi:MAG: 4Fe-4S dicluster domain-containing protein [Bacteroidales bacterium]
MANFGFTISKPRSLNLDNTDKSNLFELEKRVISFRRCINCGGCSATCSAGQFTDFNIRKIHALYRRGEFQNLEEELKKCMLCGKCTLACPRGVNLRSMIINMRQILSENK